MRIMRMRRMRRIREETEKTKITSQWQSQARRARIAYANIRGSFFFFLSRLGLVVVFTNVVRLRSTGYHRCRGSSPNTDYGADGTRVLCWEWG